MAAVLVALLAGPAWANAPVAARVLGEIARQAQAGIQPQVITVPGVTLACSVANARETKALGFKKSHLVACGSIAGEVRGALVSPTGVYKCAIGGFIDFDTDCGDLIICGRTFSTCF